jgi:hydrogenase maturation factor
MGMKPAFTRDEVIALTDAVKEICARLGIDPLSRDGRDVAARIIEQYDGRETPEVMTKRLLH